MLITGNKACSQDWMQIDNKCYQLVNEAVTWQQARDQCQSYNGYLLNIHDVTEQETVLQMFPITDNLSYWIGLHKNADVRLKQGHVIDLHYVHH